MYFVKENSKHKYKITDNVKVIKEVGTVKKQDNVVFKFYKPEEENTNKMDFFKGGSK